MGLRAKIVTIVVGVTIVSLLATYGLSVWVISPSFEDMERAEAQEDLARCHAAIEREIEGVDNFAHDWASWDDTYEYLQGTRPEYVESNFADDMYLNSNLDLVMVYDLAGNRRVGNVYDPQVGDFIQMADFPEVMPRDNLLLHDADSRDPTKGLIHTTHGIMIVASRPVLTSSDGGPAVGTLMMGRFLNASRLAALSAQAGITLAVWDLQSDTVTDEVIAASRGADSDGVLIHEASSDVLHGERVLNDIQGQPLLLTESALPHNISQRGRVMVHYVNIIAAVCAGVMLAALLVLFRSAVVRPVLRIAGEAGAIEESGDLSRRIGRRSSDELGELSHQFDRLLSRIEDDRDRLTQTNRILTEEICHHEACDVALKQANEQLSELASMDELTGLANRRSFMQILEHDLERCRRDGQALSVAMIDVDYLMTINDTWGHVVGDRALREISEAMQSEVRTSDVLARYGGDEFILLMPATPLAGAANAAERLRKAVETLVIGDLGPLATKSTVSIGVHTFFSCENSSADEMVDLADRALHKAKQERNVVHASGTTAAA
jgi:diguanylate cyclase (GGDEF)-like protein